LTQAQQPTMAANGGVGGIEKRVPFEDSALRNCADLAQSPQHAF